MPRSTVKKEVSIKKDKESKKTSSILKAKSKHPSPSKEISKKVTSGTNARANKNRIEALGRLVFARAKLLNPSGQLSNKAAFTISTLLDDVLTKLVESGLDVFSSQGRKTLNVQDLFVAYRVTLPVDISALAVFRSCRGIAERRGNIEQFKAFHTVASSVDHQEPRFKLNVDA